MVRRMLIGAGLLLLAACAVSRPQQDASVQPVDIGSSTASTQGSDLATGNGADASDSDTSGVTTAPLDEPDSAPEQGDITVLLPANIDISTQVRVLGGFGYRPRPSPPDRQVEANELSAAFPSLVVSSFDLNWGIDSSAVLVTAEGDSQTVGAAAASLSRGSSWIQSGPGWLIVLYRTGLTSPPEMERLMETLSWIADPGWACDTGQAACPYGTDVGFPPPPPILVANDAVHGELPFQAVVIDDAHGFAENGGPLLWIADGMVFTTEGPSTDLSRAQSQGPGSVATNLGCFTFAVDGAMIVVRSCNGQPTPVSWPIPDDLDVVGLAVVGNFGHNNYRLIVSTQPAGSESVTISLALPTKLFTHQVVTVTDTPIESLAGLDPSTGTWSLPRRNSIGGLTVVEQRADGWYLVDDALADPVDILRSVHPIVAYDIDAGRHHIVLSVDGPGGAAAWWIRNQIPVKLDTNATSLAWSGNHSS